MTTSETKLFWIDADDWQETAERGQPFTLCDAANNDVAEIFHNNHDSVPTTPEQAAAYCRMFVAAPLMAEALAETQRMFGFMKSVIQSGESWSPTCQESYDKACTKIDAALSSARVED